MEQKKNIDIVRLIFRMKATEKAILNLSHHLKGIKVTRESTEQYNRCLTIYQEASSYFFQCCGFLKSQYFNDISNSGKNFFINSLCIPSYKHFLSLSKNLSLIEVDDIYSDSLSILKSNVDKITNELIDFINEMNNI